MRRFSSTFMALFLLGMAFVLGALNYYLWLLQEDKKQSISDLQEQLSLQERENRLLYERNEYKAREVNILRSAESSHIYEEKLRQDYGMIGKNETFFVLNDQDFRNIPDVVGLSAFERNGNSPTVIARESEEFIRQEAERQTKDLRDTPPPPPVLELESLQ